MNQSKLPPNELRFNDLYGVASVNLKKDENFNQLAARLAGYDPGRYAAVALRVFIQENPVVTVYARDTQADAPANNEGKLRVHKFKREIGFEELFHSMRQFNFTVTTEGQSIENMEVVNE
jgi:hypothetical protein